MFWAEKYQSYNDVLRFLDLESLADRRRKLCLNFAKKCQKNEKMKNMFTLNDKIHEMKTRYKEKFYVNQTKTSRLKNLPVIYMQRLMN